MSQVKCEVCHTLYDHINEPKEIQEGGTHICPDCWTEEKQDVIIDHITTEDGFDLYSIHLDGADFSTPPSGLDNGLFLYPENIDEYIDRYNVIKDYR